MGNKSSQRRHPSRGVVFSFGVSMAKEDKNSKKREPGKVKKAKDDIKKPTDDPTRDFLNLAMTRLKRCIDADAHNRKEAVDDNKFTVLNKQWDSKAESDRKLDGRPTLKMNLMNAFIKRLVGDQRQSRPRTKVTAVDLDADSHIATIRQGMLWNIERESNADALYDTAYEGIVRCGYGAWRILTDYTEEDPFQQKVIMERVLNPLAVYLDPRAKDFMYADAEYGFVLSKRNSDELKEEYPDRDIAKGPTLGMKSAFLGSENWYSGNMTTVAEYFVREKEEIELCLMSDGNVLTPEEAEEQIAEFKQQLALAEQTNPEQLAALDPEMLKGPQIVKTKTGYKYTVKQYIITANEILNKSGLEGDVFPGKYIPLVLVRGEETCIEGKTYIRSFVRPAKDQQRMINYLESSIAERMALEPKAPWLMTPEQIAGFETDYEQANTRNFSYLLYNSVENAPIPQRVGPGGVSGSLFQQAEIAHQRMRDILGMHSADVGDIGREVSGAAIQARQLPGDISAFIYIDNLMRAVQHSARIINEILPDIYDTERDVRIRNMDDSETVVPINTNVANATRAVLSNPDRYKGYDLRKLEEARQQNPNGKFNDLSQGRYAVTVDRGPSFATQRQQAVASMLDLIKAVPSIAQLGPDIICKNMDFPGSDELEQRVRKTMPPGLAKPKEGENPQPLPPSPAQQMQMLDMQTRKAKADAAVEDAKTKRMKVMVEAAKLEKLGVNQRDEMQKMIFDVLHDLINPEEEQQAAPGAPQPGPQGMQPMQGQANYHLQG